MRKIALLLISLALVGCAPKMVYVLADGRVPAGDPSLKQQLERAEVTCNDEVALANQGGDHRDGGTTRGADVEEFRQNCMSESGYVLVREDQLGAKQSGSAFVVPKPLQSLSPASR
jgi:hypothetical protein